MVYPNPWNGEGPLKLSVTLGAPGEVQVKLFTSAFRKVWQDQFLQEPSGNDQLLLSLPRLANGIYYLVVESEGKRWVVKLIVLG